MWESHRWVMQWNNVFISSMHAKILTSVLDVPLMAHTGDLGTSKPINSVSIDHQDL